MNIDITALLLGGAQGKPKMGLLLDEGFNLALDDKLAELATLPAQLDTTLQLDTALAAPALPASVLPKQVTHIPATDGELLIETPLVAGALAGVDLGESTGEENPNWQLQQLVTRSVVGTGAATRPEQGKPVEVTSTTGEEPVAPSAKTKSPLAVSANTNTSVMTSQSVQVETVGNTVEAEPSITTTVSAVALPATVRTNVAHAPQQVVTVNHPPETPEWKQSVSQHIAIFSRNGLHNAEIRLHPEELGSLHITLRVQQEQAQIHIVSENAHVRQAMEHAMPQLRAAMAESGIQLGQANVGADSQYAGMGERGEGAPGEQQTQQGEDDVTVEDEMVSTLLTTTSENIYGINTFA
jgi:flagellar hook-length control protein FliK